MLTTADVIYYQYFTLPGIFYMEYCITSAKIEKYNMEWYGMKMESLWNEYMKSIWNESIWNEYMKSIWNESIWNEYME